MTTMTAPRSRRVREHTTAAQGRVDREAGIIHGCRILGRVSSNGRDYSPKAMADAVKMYEGRKVFIDHSTRERSVADLFGVLRDCYIEGDAVFGNLHYNREHPLAGQIAEAAIRFPTSFGLSHDATGKTSGGGMGGRLTVEGLESVHSVDIVSNPASNAGLFESHATSEYGRTKATGRFLGDFRPTPFKPPTPMERSLREITLRAARQRDDESYVTLRKKSSRLIG